MNTIQDLIDAIADLRKLIDNAENAGIEHLPPRAEQDFLLAMAHLRIAQIEMQRCNYHRMQDQ